MKKHMVIFKKIAQTFFNSIKNPAGKIALIAILALIVVTGVHLGTKNTVFQQTQTTTLGLKSIGELATQSAYYTNVNVHEEDKKLFNWSIPLTQSKYIFSYGGVIKAGYDFAQVQVDIDDAAKRVIVTLPEVKTLSNEIDPTSLKIYDERQSIFTPLSIADVNAAQEKLREEAQQTAIANGLFDNARENMELLIKGILSSTIDFTVYELIIQ